MRISAAVVLAMCGLLGAASAADVTFGRVSVKKGATQPLAWQSRGNGIWRVMKDGTLSGQRDLIDSGPRKQWFDSQTAFRSWLDQQAWLYTEAEYGDFDLEFEYWLRIGGNSGVAVWDRTRGEAGITIPPDYSKTPSKVAYEIQINNQFPDPKPTGSIYNVQQAAVGAQIDNDWNLLKVQARSERLQVYLNGKLVAEHATLPERSKRGPVGLQLHDRFSVMMVRNLKLTAY